MISEFIRFSLSIVENQGPTNALFMKDWLDFFSVMSPRSGRFYLDTKKKLDCYIRFLSELALYTDVKTTGFYATAKACVMTGMNLGEWLELIL